MQFGNQAIIEAGIDVMPAPDRLALAAELVASVIHNEGVADPRSYSESEQRREIMDAFEDQLDELIARPGMINMALLHDTAPKPYQ